MLLLHVAYDLITRMDLTPSYGRLVTVVMIIATIIFNLALSTTSLAVFITYLGY